MQADVARTARAAIVQAGRLFGVPIMQTSPQALHQLLFQYIPAQVSIEPEVAPFVIEAARQVMTLAEQLGIEAARECLASLATPDLYATRARAR